MPLVLQILLCRVRRQERSFEEGLGVMGIGSAAYFENGDGVFYTYLVIDFVDCARVAF